MSDEDDDPWLPWRSRVIPPERDAIIAWLERLQESERNHNYWAYIARRIREGEHLKPPPPTEQPLMVSDGLRKLIERARNHVMTPEEIEAQRQSFIRGMGPCEHGDYDWETCPKCLDRISEEQSHGK